MNLQGGTWKKPGSEMQQAASWKSTLWALLVGSSGGRGALALWWWWGGSRAVWGVSKEPGHSSTRREACSKGGMVWCMSQAVAREDLPSPLFWGIVWAREGRWQIVKKYTCVESSNTVRLSYVLLDSWKFVIFFILCIFQIFYNEHVFFESEK